MQVPKFNRFEWSAKNFKNKGPNFCIRGSDTWNKYVIGIAGYVSRYPTTETTLAVNSKAFHELAKHETRETLVIIVEDWGLWFQDFDIWSSKWNYLWQIHAHNTCTPCDHHPSSQHIPKKICQHDAKLDHSFEAFWQAAL